MLSEVREHSMVAERTVLRIKEGSRKNILCGGSYAPSRHHLACACCGMSQPPFGTTDVDVLQRSGVIGVGRNRAIAVLEQHPGVYQYRLGVRNLRQHPRKKLQNFCTKATYKHEVQVYIM